MGWRDAVGWLTNPAPSRVDALPNAESGGVACATVGVENVGVLHAQEPHAPGFVPVAAQVPAFSRDATTFTEHRRTAAMPTQPGEVQTAGSVDITHGVMPVERCPERLFHGPLGIGGLLEPSVVGRAIGEPSAETDESAMSQPGDRHPSWFGVAHVVTT